MKYINKYLEYLKVVKKYSDKTIEKQYDIKEPDIEF